MQEENIHRLKIEQMKRFYEIFPYPNRSFIFAPYLRNQLSAHGAFSKLISEDNILAAQNLLAKTLRTTFRKKTNIKELLANCVVENVASRRIMKKIGMQREGILRNFFEKDGRIYNSYMYSVLRHEWMAKHHPETIS